MCHGHHQIIAVSAPKMSLEIFLVTCHTASTCTHTLRVGHSHQAYVIILSHLVYSAVHVYRQRCGQHAHSLSKVVPAACGTNWIAQTHVSGESSTATLTTSLKIFASKTMLSAGLHPAPASVVTPVAICPDAACMRELSHHSALVSETNCSSMLTACYNTLTAY